MTQHTDVTREVSPNPDKLKDARAEAVVKKHMTYAMLGGAVPVPILDIAAVTAVQLDMLRQLAAIYDARFDGASARAFVTSTTSALLGNLVARLGASLIKIVPGIGTLGGGIAQAVLTGASTYAVGNLFSRLFREGRTIEALDAEEVKQEVARYFEQGKELARKTAESIRKGVGV